METDVNRRANAFGRTSPLRPTDCCCWVQGRAVQAVAVVNCSQNIGAAVGELLRRLRRKHQLAHLGIAGDLQQSDLQIL